MNSLDVVIGEMKPVVCIAGPTASGKSAYAIDLAKAVDGEIINADALQVYEDLHILSARPSEDEMDGIPHHMFGHVSGDTAYSTGQWVRDVVPVILDVLSRGKFPVLVGGTGLYFKALLVGLADVPAVSEAVMADVGKMTIDMLQHEAKLVDPEAFARVLGDDPQRLGRIIGVYRSSGRSLSSWRQETRPIIPMRYARPAVILPDREILYDRINTRFGAMIAAGALKEAKCVHDQSISKPAPMLKAIGLSHLLWHIEGELSLLEAIDLAKRDSRRLAKRQMTWFRNQTPDWPVLSTEQDRIRFTGGLS